MSTHVPPFSQRFGMHPILTLQEAPVNPNGHECVLVLLEATDATVVVAVLERVPLLV